MFHGNNLTFFLTYVHYTLRRRDSFITHRAFCDALAQESARMPPIGAGLYGGSGNMQALGLSGMSPQMPSGFVPDQAGSGQSSDVLHLGGGNGAAQFEHIMGTSSAAGSSMFRPSQASSPFYLGGAQEFAEDSHRSHGHGGGSSLLHGKPAAAFHGLMQLPDQHQGSSSSNNSNNNNGGSNNSNLLNLGFFPGNGQDARFVFQNQFNSNGNANGNGENGLLGGIGIGAGGSFPSIFNNNSSEPSGGLPQMSATALLQKAAQMGATTSSHNVGGSAASSLLRGAGSRGDQGGSSSSSAAAMSERQHQQSFQNLIMNSLASGGGGVFPGVDDGKLSTRDFLGVGAGMVQAGMSAMGPPRRQGAAGLHIGSLDPAEMK